MSSMIETGTLKRIHVNQHIIRRNVKTGERNPPITVRHKKRIYRTNDVRIVGISQLKYSPDKPLSCGARLWLETTGRVVFE